MNLMKLFNLNYLIQNLKKSKTVLAIFIGIIPILNTITLIMMLTNNPNHILNFASISIINIIGIYILPIVISICLFNYIYKRKSVDFINSMPISRKSIYITNTILGVSIFTLMLLINSILIYIVTSIFNTPIPFMMLFDYFWFFLLVYIFTFSATNLAMTISGNAITQVIVTLLLFFLVPYTSLYIQEQYKANTYYNVLLECDDTSCTPEKYYCYDDIECNINKQLNRYQPNLIPLTKHHYTTPFGLIYNSLDDNNTIIDSISIIKMIILSITYIILGYFLFLKRKMEVSETSFKNPHTHNFVKSLTLVPFVSIAYLILKEQEPIFFIFFIVIMLVYFFIYDLITKKSIQNIKLSCLYFVITLSILTAIFSIAASRDEKTNIVKYSDIKEIAINLGDHTGKTNDQNKIYLKNQELISLLTKTMLNNGNNNYYTDSFETTFKTSNNREYRTYISVTAEIYDEVLTILSEEQSYVDYYKNIDMNESYKVIKLGNKIYSKKDAKPYMELIYNSINNLTLKEFIELQKKYRGTIDDYQIKLYNYKNHDIKEFAINAYINYDLLNSIVNSNNKLIKENITPIIPSDYYLYYENAYLNEALPYDYHIMRSAKKEIYEFILNNIDDEIDMRKEYITFNIQLNYTRYHFTTNKIEAIKQILDKKYNEIKDGEEYQDYYKEEQIEYYD